MIFIRSDPCFIVENGISPTFFSARPPHPIPSSVVCNPSKHFKAKMNTTTQASSTTNPITHTQFTQHLLQQIEARHDARITQVTQQLESDKRHETSVQRYVLNGITHGCASKNEVAALKGEVAKLKKQLGDLKDTKDETEMEKEHADELKKMRKEIAKIKETQSEMVMASQHMVDLRELWDEIVKLRRSCDMGTSDAEAQRESKVDPAELALYGGD